MNGKRGGKRFYRARIRRANADGTFDLDYDDGQKEKCVEEAMMREPEEEQRVEAQKWSCVTTYARQPLDRCAPLLSDWHYCQPLLCQH